MQFRFDTLSEFLHMAGHGPYVWVCYAAGLLAIGFIISGPIMKHKKIVNQSIQLRAIQVRAVEAQMKDKPTQ